MNFLFLDFETETLEGPITEVCCIDSNDKSQKFNSLEEFFNMFKGTKDKESINEDIFKDKVLVIWHIWHYEYLMKYHPEFLNYTIKSRILIFTNCYALYDGFTKSRYKIAEITKELLGREHQGNALDDCKDLKDCFNMVNTVR